MVTESLVCPGCANEVPRGRLSCPHCGSVLAAVARSYRDQGGGVVPGAWVPPVAQVDDSPAFARAAGTDAAGWFDANPASGEDAATATDLEPDLGPPPSWGVPKAEPAAAPPAAGMPAPVAGPPPARILPRTWDPNASGTDPVPAATAGASASRGTARRLGFALPSIGGADRARIGDAADVLVLVGAMGTVIAMLVPWVPLGRSGIGAWTDAWGVAMPGHFIVFLLACGALALATLPNAIGPWLRTGIVGLMLGSLVLGLVWRSAFGAGGGGFGVPLTFVSGAVLAIGGLISTLVNRHAAEPPDV
ncbi:MAG TPA: hypothetical protein VLA44_10950 [Clostridia bacterium]|nr:hypothetical protein [Clostridia bacterium]